MPFLKKKQTSTFVKNENKQNIKINSEGEEKKNLFITFADENLLFP